MTMLVARASAMPDLKITIRNSQPWREGTVTYIQSDRKRVEERLREPLQTGGPGPVVYAPVPAMATITRCDLDQIFILNLDDREYMAMPIPKPPSREALQARTAQQVRPTAQPTLLIETTTEDTGERKQMFGYTARHVITTVKHMPLVESGGLAQETVTDGWYIDLDTSIPCARVFYNGFLLTGGSRKPGDPPQIPIPIFKSVGKPERGFALATKELNRLTGPLPDGSIQKEARISNEMQVTELSTASLDPALFEVPKNFRKVAQIRRGPVLSYWQLTRAWLNYYWTRLKRAI